MAAGLLAPFWQCETGNIAKFPTIPIIPIGKRAKPANLTAAIKKELGQPSNPVRRGKEAKAR
jgi:hypothetical protein